MGAGRAGREPDAIDEIIDGCARLPLALTIAAARAATSPGFPLAVFAADLREAGHALDQFDGDDEATDIRAVFSWSYRALSPDTARMFRLLGLHPGPDMTAAAAALIVQPCSMTRNTIRSRCVNDNAALACNLIRCPPWNWGLQHHPASKEARMNNLLRNYT